MTQSFQDRNTQILCRVRAAQHRNERMFPLLVETFSEQHNRGGPDLLGYPGIHYHGKKCCLKSLVLCGILLQQVMVYAAYRVIFLEIT